MHDPSRRHYQGCWRSRFRKFVITRRYAARNLKINYPVRDFVPDEKLTHDNFEDITRNGPIDPELAKRAIQTVKMALQVDKSFLDDGDNFVHPSPNW